MDYKGWVLSVYDEYIKIYNDKYGVKKNENYKLIIKNMFKRKTYCLVSFG